MSAGVLGIGIDLVDIERIPPLCPSVDAAFVKRVYTESEKAFCFAKAYPHASLAARFAVKEAVAKALGTGIGEHCELLDISTEVDDLGAPRVVLSGNALRTAQAMGITSWQLSITHTKHTAAAVVIAWGMLKD